MTSATPTTPPPPSAERPGTAARPAAGRAAGPPTPPWFLTALTRPAVLRAGSPVSVAGRVAFDRVLQGVLAALERSLDRPVVADIPGEVPKGTGAPPAFGVTFSYAPAGGGGGGRVEAMVAVDVALARAVLDAVETDFATLRGTGSVTDAEAGLLEYITLACVDQAARAGRTAGVNGAPAARSLALGEFLRAQGITEWVGRAKATAAVLNVRIAGRGGLARLYLPGWEPADLTTASGWEPATAAAPDLAALIQARLALPTVRLPASAGALRPGDVVLLGATDVTAVAGCRLVTSQGWTLAQVTVERDSADVVTVRCGALAPALWDAAAAAPGDPVLGPTVGSQFLSLEQIARWPVGAPLDLPKEMQAAVDLWRGGRIVARGELVRVDGELGVRITDLSVDAVATG